MLELISEEKVREVVDTAEATLNKCFDILSDIKKSSEALGDAIISFQPVLATCLFDVMEFYNKLNAEKNTLISQKGIIDQGIFKKAMADNAKYIKVVGDVIKIGKSLGDAFVWIFYSNNRDELDKHFEHASTGLFVAGLGGKGEIEFVKKHPSIDGLFVIYHGITDMLRVGDFSLYENGRGIVGIGELKTKQEGDKLNIYTSISSKVGINYPDEFVPKVSSSEESIRILEKDLPNLRRQIEAQDELLLVKGNENTSSIYAKYEYDILNSLTPNDPFAMNKDNSLLLYGVWSKFSRLFDVLCGEENIDVPNSFSDYAKKLNKPNISYNEVIISSISTIMLPTRKPIMWWKIDDRLCRDIYFKKVVINTVFNPATIIQKFVEDGFQVVRMGRTDEIKLVKIIDDKQMEFGSLELYMDLINHSLMETQSALSIAKDFYSKVEAANFPLDTKIEMHFRLDG